MQKFLFYPVNGMKTGNIYCTLSKYLNTSLNSNDEEKIIQVSTEKKKNQETT